MANKRVHYKIASEHSVHEGKRARRVEELRDLGFFRYEAREFAKLDRDDPGLVRIINSRRRIIRRLAKRAREEDWTDTKRRSELMKAVRKHYRLKKALVVGDKGKGEPSPWELRRRALKASSIDPRTFRGKASKVVLSKGNRQLQRSRRREAQKTTTQIALTRTGAVDNNTLQAWIASKELALTTASGERKKELASGVKRLRKVLRQQGG